MEALTTYIEQALTLGADRLEIEYENGQELITAFLGDVGVGVGAVESSQSEALYQSLERLKKAGVLETMGKSHRLTFSEYESFGETVHVIAFREVAASR